MKNTIIKNNNTKVNSVFFVLTNANLHLPHFVFIFQKLFPDCIKMILSRKGMEKKKEG